MSTLLQLQVEITDATIRLAEIREAINRKLDEQHELFMRLGKAVKAAIENQEDSADWWKKT
jgi:hypothetical protein